MNGIEDLEATLESQEWFHDATVSRIELEILGELTVEIESAEGRFFQLWFKGVSAFRIDNTGEAGNYIDYTFPRNGLIAGIDVSKQGTPNGAARVRIDGTYAWRAEWFAEECRISSRRSVASDNNAAFETEDV